MPEPILIDLSHTSHTRARTGIQRVTRSLHAALGERGLAITHDPHRDAWRELEGWERTNLAVDAAAAKRGAQWPVAAKLRGKAQRLLGGKASRVPKNSGLIVPEVFSPAVARALPALFAAVRGPRVAIFHDAIALKFPELTPAKTVARFPAYLIELLDFDGVAAVSDDSRAALVDYWRWLGVPKTPPVCTVGLGIDTHDFASRGENSPSREVPIVLTIGSIEGRKNHLALLDAAELLWAGGKKFTLQLVGLAQPQTGAAALARIRELQAAGRPLRYEGPLSDAAVEAAYAACAFTVYPSRIEGFGLPVVESVAHGKPCICSALGALGESARGGGCVALERVDAPSLAEAMAGLLDHPERRESLAGAARARRFKSWADYANELAGWMVELPPR
jgi:glycosyltransferase involved in cell wall biosynthesis